MLWRLLRRLVYPLAAIPTRRRWAAFEKETRRPREVKEQVLRRILAGGGNRASVPTDSL